MIYIFTLHIMINHTETDFSIEIFNITLENFYIISLKQSQPLPHQVIQRERKFNREAQLPKFIRNMKIFSKLEVHQHFKRVCFLRKLEARHIKKFTLLELSLDYNKVYFISSGR